MFHINRVVGVIYHLQEFTSTGSANTETSKVAGSLETKYKWAEHGLTFTEKWNTDNTLGTEITIEDQVMCCDGTRMRYRFLLAKESVIYNQSLRLKLKAYRPKFQDVRFKMLLHHSAFCLFFFLSFF